MSLTSVRDVDRLILMYLDDESLLKVMKAINRPELFNQSFFHNRFLERYPAALKHKREGESYKKYYLRFLHWLGRIREECEIPDYRYVDGDIEGEYHNCIDELYAPDTGIKFLEAKQNFEERIRGMRRF